MGAIHTGYWIDHSRTQSQQGRITISASHSYFLVAFLTLFITSVASHCWSLLCFILHQTRADGNARDGLYHQRQVLLRNRTGPIVLIAYLLRMTWSWNRRAGQVLGRQLPLIGISLSHVILWTGAAILIAFLASTGTDSLVLVENGQGCEWWSSVSEDSVDYASLTNSILQRSASYASQCYPKVFHHSTNSDACHDATSYPYQTIGFSLESGIECPFPDLTFCREPNSAIKVTSDLMNSQRHFGVNTALGDQIDYKKEMTCAPLRDEVDNELVVSENLTMAGGHLATQRSFHYIEDLDNTNNTDPLSLILTKLQSEADYQLAAETVYFNISKKSKTPNPFLAKSGLTPGVADLDVVILASSLEYMRSSTDPIFGTVETSSGKNVHRGFSAVGCVTKHQFCNPVNGLCTQMGGWGNLGHDSDDRMRFILWNDDGITDKQRGNIYNIRQAAKISQLSIILKTLQSNALLATRKVSRQTRGVSLGLDRNQTAQEVQYWFSIGLAAMQEQFLIHAQTPIENAAAASLQKSQYPYLNELCASQTIKDSNFISISLAGLLVILVLGSFIILLSLIVPPAVGLIQRRKPHGSYARSEWQAGGILHLLTSVFPSDTPTWSTVPMTVPTTMPYEKFTFPMSSRPATAKTDSASAVVRERGLSNADIAALPPGTSRSIGSIRYAALPTSSNRPRGPSINDVAPPVMVLRDGERPRSWVVLNSAETDGLLRDRAASDAGTPPIGAGSPPLT